MMQNLVFLLPLFLTTTYAGYAGSYSGNNVGSGGSSGGYGYGYGGQAPPGFPQQFFQQVPFDFSSLISGYLDDLMKHHQTLMKKTKAYAYTSISVNSPFQGKVMARSRITYDGLQNLQSTIQQQASAGGSYSSSGSVPYAYGGGYGSDSVAVRSGGNTGGGSAYPAYGGGGSYGGGYGSSYGGGYGGSYSGASGAPGGYGAGASASVGQGGGHQTAYLSPENPASPNVNVRFGGGADGGGDGKAYSVFTSSSSGSGNVDGKPYGFRRAQTTINDNGKVSTYSVTD